MTKTSPLSILSKSEQKVHDYIKEISLKNNGIIKESMISIGKKIGVSEATVHRAVRKLRSQGVIGIHPSMEKAESNEIVYYGIPDPEKEAEEIIKMINSLNLSANRFEEILNMKQKEIDQLKREKESCLKKINELDQELEQANKFLKGTIISSQSIKDGVVAYVIKTTT